MTTHITAQDITVDGHYVRQRCAWCGELILDQDADAIQKPIADIVEGQTAAQFVGVWPTSRFVRVEGEWPRVYELLDEEERYPEDSCMAIDPAVTA